MANWKYVGVEKGGKTVSGELEATSEKEVRQKLRAKGIRPKKVSMPSILDMDLGELLADRGLVKPFGKAEILNFTRQLGVMIDAGVPILQCLEILYKSQKNISFKKLIKKIAEEVGGGKSLSDALNKKPGFSIFYINMIKAGEAGGVLDKIFSKLVNFMERDEKTKKAVKSALTYPAITAMVGMVVVVGLMVFVIPKFTDMIAASGEEVPLITQIVVSTSDLFRKYFLAIFVGGIASIIALSQYVKSKEGKIIFDKILIKLPLIGDIIIKGSLTSFSLTLSTMLGSGVALIDSLSICIDTIENSVIAKDIAAIRSAVTHGETITAPLLRIKYFPDLIGQMVKVGEQTGELDTILAKVANVFEEDVRSSVDGMLGIIEPVTIIVLGGIVAVIIVAMYLPIFMSAGGAS